MRYITTIGEREYLIEIIDEHTLLVNGVRYHIDFEFGQRAAGLLLTARREVLRIICI